MVFWNEVCLDACYWSFFPKKMDNAEDMMILESFEKKKPYI